MDFSVEETKALAKLERDMDSGAMPYVMFNWSRMAVTPDIMEELGLEQGQTINQAIMMSIMQAALAARCVILRTAIPSHQPPNKQPTDRQGRKRLSNP